MNDRELSPTRMKWENRLCLEAHKILNEAHSHTASVYFYNEVVQ